MEYITLQEAARRLERSEKTLRRWVHSGKLPHHMEHGRYMVSTHDVEALSTPQMPEVYQNILTRLDALERRLIAIERQLAAHPPAPKHAPPSQVLHKAHEVAPGIMGWRHFATLHNIPASTVQKSIAAGRMVIVEGRWKVGKTIVHGVLDTQGQERFVQLFRGNAHFRECDDPECVCHRVSGS